MRALYLTGDQVYVRAMLADDKYETVAWFPSPFPVNSSRAEEWLRQQHKGYDDSTNRYYVIVSTNDEKVVGGVKLSIRDNRRATIYFHMAPYCADLDELRAQALLLLVPWVRDDLEFMTLTVVLAADEAKTIEAAEQMGLVVGARLRQFKARGDKRVDVLLFQAINKPWRVKDA